MRVLRFNRVRPLDAAIIGVAALVIIIGGWLGYSVWSQNRANAEATPASRAIDELVATLRKNPNNIDIRLQLAQALSVAGRDRESAEQYKAVLKVRKDYAPALSGLGFIYMKQKDWATGQGYFQKVIDQQEGKVGPGTDSQLETAYFYVGTALMEQGEYEDAISNFKQALRHRRDASDTHYALAVCYKAIGSDAKYKDELEATLLFDPKMPEANYDYGRLLLASGDRAGAAERFRKSVDSAPAIDAPREALDGLGPVEERIADARKLREKEPAQALVEARIAAALEPTDAGVQVLLGELYEKAGDLANAQTAYRAALASAPEDKSAKAGLERVTNAN